MEESEYQFEKRVINSLLELPAYRLSYKDKKIFENYVIAELAKSISTESLDTNFALAEFPKPNTLKIFLLSFKSLSSIYQKIGCLALIFFPLGFLARTSNLILILIGVICFLLFSLSFLLYGTQLSINYSYIKNIFTNTNKLIDDIKQYIYDYDIKNQTNLNREIYIVLNDFIEDDISDLDYSWKKINLFNILSIYYLHFSCLFYVFILQEIF